nr:MAG TPA: hypothetical protein [Caudoviricetes sp.]
MTTVHEKCFNASVPSTEGARRTPNQHTSREENNP